MFSHLQRNIFSYKTVFFIVLLLLIVAVFSCGQFQMLDHHSGNLKGVVGCDSVFSSITSNGSRDGIFLGFLLLLLVLFGIKELFTKKDNQFSNYLLPSFVFVLKNHADIRYNLLEEAFRKGIIHPQIYNLSLK